MLQVHVNEKRRYPAYRNSDLQLTGTDMMINLEIPKINTVVTYTDSAISIKLPYDLFTGNTEGQCGEFINIFWNIRCKKLLWNWVAIMSNSVFCLIMCYLKTILQHGNSCFITPHLFFQEPATTLSRMTVVLQMARSKPAKTLQTSGKFLVHLVLPQEL